VTEAQFQDLLMLIRGSDAGVAEMLQKVDPYDNQKISFSDCVMLFSNESDEASGSSVLQMLSQHHSIGSPT
jgi:hypothetical protein